MSKVFESKKVSLLFLFLIASTFFFARQLRGEEINELSAWEDYYARSIAWQKTDADFIDQELAQLQLKQPSPPTRLNRFNYPLKEDQSWYQSEQARTYANNIISFQTPSGGWSKRTEMMLTPRQLGEAFGTEKKYIPTLDNDATTAQMRFLARVFSAAQDPSILSALTKAVNYLLEAQYPNGCWPQNYPLVGDYHDHITFNDKAMVNVLTVLQDIVLNQNEFSFEQSIVDKTTLEKIENSVSKGITCILDAQVMINGELTAWGAQHDAMTLKPQSARAYEMASLASQESQEIVEFLMQQFNPSPRLVDSVDSAMQWFERSLITGKQWKREGDSVAELIDNENGITLWSRFYELESNRPVFGDRDGSVHYDVNEISLERRLNYRWYTDEPSELIGKYRHWKVNIVN